MYNQDTLQRAINYLAATVTHNQFIHCENVAHRIGLLDENYLLALLHDIVEDKYLTVKQAKDMFRLNDQEVLALISITRNDGEQYFDYIKRVNQNETARKVKLADLQDNMYQCVNQTTVNTSLLKRYVKAYDILTENRTTEKS